VTADIIVDGLFKRKKCCPGQERRIGPEKQRFKGCLAVRPRSTLEILHQEHPKYGVCCRNPVVKEPQRAALKHQERWSCCAWGARRMLIHAGRQMLRKEAHQDTQLSLVSPRPIGPARPQMCTLHWTRGSMQRSITL